MKKRFWLLLSLILATAVFGSIDLNGSLIAPDILQAAAQASGAEYPNADVLIVDDSARTSYEKDGTYRYINDVALKILTEKGRQENSTVSLGYSAAYGTLRFVRAELTKSDGRTIPIDVETQSRDVISAGQMSSNIYDPNHKEIQLTVPGLEIGDVLRYTFAGEQTKTVVPDTWSDIYTLEEPNPILHARYEIDAPASLPLKRIELRDEIPGTVSFHQENIGERIRYIWEARDVPQMFDEPQMPQRHTVVQRLLVSTIPDWESLSRWYWELSKPRIENINSNLTAKVEELTDGLSDRKDKIEAIFRFVSQDIRYMGITIEDEAPGYEPHDVCLTFDNRYGVCRDKAALLVAMLREAGIDAYPVLIYVGPKKDPDVPQPWFNHAITGVRNEDGSYLLMDATNENTRDLLPAYLDNRSYLVAHPDGETLLTSPVMPPEDNLLTIDVDARLSSENLITASATLSFGGIHDTAYRGRLAGLKPDERRPYFEERLKRALGNARLTKLDIQPEEVRDTTQPLSLRLAFEIENAMAEGSPEALLRLPTLVNHLGLFGAVLGNGIGLDKRRYPLNTSITCGVTETVRLDLRPSGYRAETLPSYETVDTPELFIRRSAAETNGVLTATADLMLRTVEFTPEQYLDLKKDLKAAERNARKQLILARDGFPPEADLAILDSQVEYKIFDSHNWRETRTVRKQVLTYAGKNAASDIKILYNPANQSAELNRATVTKPDGTVLQIDPAREVNEMDAAWAGRAPRYPAEKIKVANLPGVEIGSVIEYTITREFRDQPFFSAKEFFADYNPLVRKTVRLEAPRKMAFKIDNMHPTVVNQRTSLEGENSVYTWHIENQEMVRKEERMPPGWITFPSVYVSDGNLKEYAKELNKTLRKAAKKSKVARAKAAELTDGPQTDSEKLIAIRDFVDQSVRAAGPGLSRLPLSEISPADQTLAEGYGNSSDRAALLYAMCRKAKLNPRFVLTSNLPRPAGVAYPDLSTLQQNPFDTVLVAVEANDTVFYLGDSDQYAQIGTLKHTGRTAINLETGEIELLKSPLKDATETMVRMTVRENGDVQLKTENRFYGTLHEAFHRKFKQLTPEELIREHQRLLSELSQSAQADGNLQPDFNYPGTLSLSAELPQYAVRENGHLYLTLPGGLENLLNLQASKRENIFHIRTATDQSIIYELMIPDGWEPVLIPESFAAKLPAGAGTVQVQVFSNNGKVSLIQRAQLNPALIPAEDYPRVLHLHDRLTAPAARTVLLRKTEGPETGNEDGPQ